MNELKHISDDINMGTNGYYGYDDAGERTYKIVLNTMGSLTNAYGTTKMLDVEKVMMYPNGYININQSGEYTKHYYADEARIASKIGTGLGMIGSDTISYFVPGNEWSIGYIVTAIVPKYSNTLTVSSNTDTTFNRIAKQELGLLTGDTIDIVNYSLTAITSFVADSTVYEDGLYFYHGNHLSSTQLVTDIAGSISQAVLYAPFGQIISEYRYDWMLDTIPRYLFNAKPLDEESGLYDYGARSYDPNSGTFISRDKLVENFFWISGYAYCMNNPVKYIDPDGNVFTTTIKVKEQQENGKNKNVQYNVTFNGTTAEMKNVKTGEAKQYQSGTSKFVDNMVTAYNYIVNNGADVDGAMQQMAESHIEIKVIKTANTAEYSKGTIKMDFSKGSKVKRDDGESGYQSPALGFWGEVYHSYLDKIATKTKGTLTDKNDSYNTNEENYVHLNKESEVIDNLNGKGNSETKRGKYGDAWKTERMKDVTSTIPD